MLRVEMLATGDEVLHGQIVDANAAWLAERLFAEGLPMTSRATVGDNLLELVAVLQERSKIADVLIVNGGLGPTSDDLSSQAAASAAGVRLQLQSEWLVKMEAWFSQSGRLMPPGNRKQAEIPQGAEILDNPIGTACGFALELNRCWLFFTPGVPAEFKKMVTEQVIPRIRQRFTTPEPPVCLRLTTFGCGESSLAAELERIPLPDGVVMGYRSSMPLIELKLTGPASEQAAMTAIWQQVRQVAGEHLIYEGTETLPQQLARRLTACRLTLSISEQYTGGLLNWYFTSAAAPLTAGEVLPPQSESLATLASRNKAGDVALTVGDWQEDGSIALALRTPDGVFAQRVKLSLHRYSLCIRQETVAMAAMNMLRRWLEGGNANGGYGWVGVVEECMLSA